MRVKRAVVTFELVDESSKESNERLARELLEWFTREEVLIPWVKDVKNVKVEDDQAYYSR
ncbi:MAG: hypothetical protein QXZ25_00475 [Candidatus Bathyarchaeia archaeon]